MIIYNKLGEHLKYPFILKRIVGQSGMSYGALGKNAITALSKGLAKAGTWMRIQVKVAYQNII